MKKYNDAIAPATIGKESFVWDSIPTPTKHIAYDRHDIVAVKDKIYDLVRKGNMIVVIDASEGYALEASTDGNPRRQLSGWGYTVRLSYEGIHDALKAAKGVNDREFIYLLREYIIPRYRRYINAE